MPSSASSLKYMKATYEATFASHVKTALERAVAIGAKATWTTAKHLDALSAAIDANPGATRDVLGECYNVSAYQQVLAKKFEKTGHFQRSATKTASENVDDLLSELVKSVSA